MGRRKWALLCAAVVAAAAVGGCGGTSGQESVTVTADIEAEAQEEVIEDDADGEDAAWPVSGTDLFTIGYAAGGEPERCRETIEDYRRVFCEENGYELTAADCAYDNAQQLVTVREWIAEQMDYIIVTPAEPEGWKDVLKEAQQAGVPIIITGREVDADVSLYDAWVGNDAENDGTTVGNWLAEYLSGGKADIAVIENSFAPTGYMKGFRQIASQHSEWKLVNSQSGDMTREEGRRAMESLIRLTGGQFRVVICESDAEASGAMEAMDAASITYGTGGDVVLIVFGTAEAGLQGTLEGKIHCSAEYMPFEADTVEKVIRGLAEGGSYDEPVLTGGRVFAAPGAENSYAGVVTEEEAAE